MYDPSTARFLSTDPLYEEGGHPNLYLYCGNDPINRVDPSGKEYFFLGEDQFLTDTLNKLNINYTIYNVPHDFFTRVNLPGFQNTSAPPNLKVIIIDSKDIDEARKILDPKSLIYGSLYSFTEHTISWPAGGMQKHAPFTLIKSDEQVPTRGYWGSLTQKMGYYPGINYLLRLNYFAGYSLHDLLDVRNLGLPLGKRVNTGRDSEAIKLLLEGGKFAEVYRRYLTASKEFPLFPGGNLLKGFLELIASQFPFLDKKTRSFLNELIANVPADLFDVAAALLSPEQAIGPLLAKVLRPVFVELVNKLTDDKAIRDLILQAFDTIIAGRPLDPRVLIQLLPKLDARTEGLVDLLDLLSGSQKFDCEKIIKILTQIGPVVGFDVTAYDVRRLRECCNAAKQGQNLKPDDLIKMILGALGLRLEEAARLEALLKNLKVISKELQSKNPDLKLLTEAIANILPELLGKDDRVGMLQELVKQLGIAAAVVQKLQAASQAFKKGDNDGAIDNSVQALKLAGLQQQAKQVEDNKPWLVWLLGFLGGGLTIAGIGTIQGLGLNNPEGGGNLGVLGAEGDKDECYKHWPDLLQSNPFYHTEDVEGAISNTGKQSLFDETRTTYVIMRIEGGTELPIPGGSNTDPNIRNYVRDYGRSVESYGKKGGDQAGHIIAANFGGSGKTRTNIIPIDWDLNDREATNPRYTNGEIYIAKLVEQGNTVCFRISFKYESPTRKLRPSHIKFEIIYRSTKMANEPWKTVPTTEFDNGKAIP